MFNYESINLGFAYSGFYFFLALLILAGYSWYVYRYTVPIVSPSKKLLLVGIRALALILLLFIVFEPIVTVAKKNILEPVILIFADNSRSLTIKDGTNRAETVNSFLQDAVGAGFTDNTGYYSFGNKVTSVHSDSLERINFSEGSTDFSEIFSSITSENDLSEVKRNISSIVIISDGVITGGSSPVYSAEKLGIPVYTVGVGDTTHHNDIEIRNIIHNDFIYAETPTAINAAISGKGFGGKTVSISLYENDQLLEQKSLQLGNDGFQNTSFEYTPKTGGEKKLSVTVSEQPGEFSTTNNRRTFYVNVLSNKIKVLLAAGAPSTDVTFIKNALKEDKNLVVNTITQIGANKFLETNNGERLVDSADILYLVGFPSKETPDNLLQKISAVVSAGKPFFLVLSDGIDLNKLKQLQKDLPFSIGRTNSGFSEVQPEISIDKAKNSLLQSNAENSISAWNNLPPVLQQNTALDAKPESEVLSRVKINNMPLNRPLVISRRLGSKRSIAVLAKDIWRWKLQTSTKNLNLFDSFILQGVKWLNSTEEQKQVTIKTSKKLYSLGEEVEFSAQVYDEAFNPVNDAEVKVNINSGNDRYEINLNSIGSGLYEGTFQSNKPGDYTFSGTALQNSSKLGSDNGRFNIGEVDIELVNTRMDSEFLSLLANQTGGRYFNAQNYPQLFNLLKQRNESTSKENITVSEINLWSNEWLMTIVIFLFALEWFIRKRSGML